MADSAEPRKPGRPKAEEPCSTISAWVPVATHDKLIAMAKARDVSVSGLVGQLLRLRLPQSK